MDALLYTNNATMFLAKRASAYAGQAIINGGLVGADMGILVPGTGDVGLRLNFDGRHNGALQLRDTGSVELVRSIRVR